MVLAEDVKNPMDCRKNKLTDDKVTVLKKACLIKQKVREDLDDPRTDGSTIEKIVKKYFFDQKFL